MTTGGETTLANQRVVVIGGHSNIGRTTARAVADRGGQAIITRRPRARDHQRDTGSQQTDQTDTPGANVDARSPTAREPTSETAADDESDILSADRDHIDVYELDSTDEAAVASFFEDVDAFDHLICATERVPTGGPLETGTETLREVFDVAFWGPYYAAKHSVHRLDDRSTITFVSGTAAHKPSIQFFALGVANAAVETMTKYLAVEIGPIRVNAVSPGRVDALGLSAETQQTLVESVPANRVGDPADIADAILFVVTNPHTTGTVIRVDGGEFLK